MAALTSKTLGCSGCLIEAIERCDEATLRQLLFEPNVEFHDTFWIATPDVHKELLIAPFRDGPECFPALFEFKLASRFRRSPTQCAHSMEEGHLCDINSYPKRIAMSVVLTSMLHSTSEFNALQILVDSQKFDLSDYLIFHFKDNEYVGLEHWSLVAIDAFGLAILIDSVGNSTSSSFLLLKTLKKTRF